MQNEKNTIPQQDLIERYIYAATRKLPQKQQADIAAELRTLISDMLEERCGGMPPTGDDVRAALTALGTPNELHEQYDANGKRCLIGAPYYTTYCLVVKIVLICAVFGLTLAAAVACATEPGVPWLARVTTWLGSLWSGALEAFALVTILFAVFYHSGVKLDMAQSLDDLPPVPKQSARISRGESLFGIAFSVLFLAVFLAAPQFICAIFSEDGAMRVYPVFNVSAVRAAWYLPAALCALGIGRDLVKLIEGCYTKKVLVATLLANALSAVLFVWWLSDGALVNPAFCARMTALFSGEAAFLGRLFAALPQALLAVILFALLLDTVTAAAKALRAR